MHSLYVTRYTYSTTLTNHCFSPINIYVCVLYVRKYLTMQKETGGNKGNSKCAKTKSAYSAEKQTDARN